MNILKWRVIVGVIGLTVLSIGTVARSQSTEAKPEISYEQLIKQLQAQIEQLQTIIKTQEAEIQRLKALCKKAGIETKPMEKELRRGGGILEFYQKYKNKYALLDGEYIFLSAFVLKDSNSDISEWTVGEYGRGYWSTMWVALPGFKIFQILGPDEMLIEYYNSVGATQTKLARFKGWSTKNLIDGEWWNNNKKDVFGSVDVAIVGTYRYTAVFGTTKTILDVVPLELFRKGITLEQFKVMLKKSSNLPEELQKVKAKFLR